MNRIQTNLLITMVGLSVSLSACEEATQTPMTVVADAHTPPEPDSSVPADQSTADTNTPPNQPPEFSNDAAISVLDLNATYARATWPEASDDVAVTRYEVRINGELIDDIGDTNLEAPLSNLTPFTSYAVSVQAVDGQGARSEPLVTTFQTSDNEPPSWPEPSTIALTHVDETTASFTFSPATDNRALAGYRLYLDGEPLGDLETSTTILLNDLSPLTSYSLTIWAEDITGFSSVGPTIDWSTLDLTPPAFPEDAALTVSTAAPAPPTGATLTWTAAADNTALNHYELRHNANAPVLISPDTLSHTLQNIPEGSPQMVRIRAFDIVGLVSTTTLEATFSLGDSIAPSFPPEWALVATHITPSTVAIAWPPAQDNVAITHYDVLLDGQPIGQTGAQNYTLSDLAPSTTYAISLVAYDGAGNASAASTPLQVTTPDYSPPTWPKGATITIDALGDTTATLSWPEATDNVGIAGYQVTLGEDLIPDVGLDTTLSVIDLVPFTSYTVNVVAIDTSGTPTLSAITATFQTTDSVLPEWSDLTITATDIGMYSAMLTWEAPTDNVDVATISLFEGDNLVTELPGTATSYPLNNLAPWTEYTYSLSATDTAGNTSESTPTASFKTQDTIAPFWPTGAELSAVPQNSDALALSWPIATDNVQVSSYVVTIDGQQAEVVSGETNTFTVTGLEDGSTLLLDVVAQDAAGNQSAAIQLTFTIPDVTPPTWTEPFVTWTGTEDSITLSWGTATDNQGVVAYNIFRDNELIATANSPTAIIQELPDSSTWAFRIEAGDAAGNWSTDGPATAATTKAVYDPGFRRLSKEQYARTLAALLTPMWYYCYPGAEDRPHMWPCKYPWSEATWYKQFTSGNISTVWKGFSLNYPNDEAIHADNELRGGHKRLDNRVYNEHTSAWFRGAMTVAADFFDADSNWSGPAGWPDDNILFPCILDNNAGITNYENDHDLEEACLSNFIYTFGKRAFRRPVTLEQHDNLMDIFYTDVELYPEEVLNKPNGPAPGAKSNGRWRRVIRNIMAVILTSPHFLYHIETGDETGQITAYELANRLSYHFWNRMPDDELLATAEDGTLLSDDSVYAAQVERLASDKLARSVIEEFYEGYFRTDEIDDLNGQTGPGGYGYHAATGGHPKNLKFFSNFGTMTMLRGELLHLGKWFTYEQPGTFTEMFESNLNFLPCNYSGATHACRTAGPYAHYIYEQGNCPDMMTCDNMNWCVDTGPDPIEYGVSVTQTLNHSCDDMQCNVKDENGDNVVDETGEPVMEDCPHFNSATGYQPGTTPAELTNPHRHGLLTRIGMLTHDTVYKRPIRRGLRVREMLLCDPIPPPENCDVVKPPQLTGHCEPSGAPCNANSQCPTDDAGNKETCVNQNLEVELSVRDKVELITEQPGTSCYNCHATLINGIGYALGHYSSEGRYQEKEPKFTTQKKWSWGKYAGFAYNLEAEEDWFEIDTSGSTLHNGQWVSIDGVEELSDFLVGTGRMEWCWSREYFRFTFGRFETPADSETIETMAQGLRDGDTLFTAFKSIAYTTQFKTLNKLSSTTAPAASNEEDTP